MSEVHLYRSAELAKKNAERAANSHRLERELCYSTDSNGNRTRQITGVLVKPTSALAQAVSDKDENGIASIIEHNVVSMNGLTQQFMAKYPDAVKVGVASEYRVIRDGNGIEQNRELRQEWGMQP